MSQRIRISGCMIVRNEEANIANCINNLKNVTDEIIVVDTGSEDNTIQIAKDLGVFVYEHKWENDFSKAKNTALEYAKGDWIIFLDADEYFDEKCLSEIRPLIERADLDSRIEGILCNLLNYDPVGRKFMDSMLVMRIFRSRREFRFMNRIHEQISKKGMALEHINLSDRITIIHTGYSPALQIDKARRNLEFLLNDKENKTAAYHLAITYFILRDYENADKYADLALSEKSIREVDHLAFKMHFYKIFISLMGSDGAKTESLIREANRKHGNHPEIARLEGAFYLKEKRYEKSYEKYLHALNCEEQYGAALGQNSFQSNIHEVYFSIAHILYLMNREADAFDYYMKAIRVNKYQKDIFQSMLLLLKTMPETETIAFLNSLYDISNEEDMGFLVSQIAGCGIKKVVLYYADKWNNIFGHEDDVLIYAFLALGQHQHAWEIAKLYLKENQAFYASPASAVLILGRLFPEADFIREAAGEDCYNLIKSFEKGTKYCGSTKTYLSVLSILIKHADQDLVDSYLRTGSPDDMELTNGIADIYLKDYQYDQAVHYYGLLADSQAAGEREAKAAFQAGYCYYKLKRYEDSIHWYEKAIQSGYTENDIEEFLNWIGNQTPDDSLKQKAKALAASIRAE